MKVGQSSGTVRLDVVLALAKMPLDDVPLCLDAHWKCLERSGKDATNIDYQNLGELTRAVLKSNCTLP